MPWTSCSNSRGCHPELRISAYPTAMKKHSRKPRSRRQLLGLALVLSSAAAHAESVNVRSVALHSVLQNAVHSAPATVVARNTPQIAAEIAARVVTVPVQVGDEVTVGDVLAALDCRRFESALKSAEATLEGTLARQRFADRQLQRARNLKAKKSISDETLDQRRTDLRTTQADLETGTESVRQARLDVGHCEVRSPIQAVVRQRLISVGSYATPGTPLIELVEITRQEVSAALRHDQLASFNAAAGQLRFESNGTRFPLTLRSVVPASDSLSRTREARMLFTHDAAIPGTAGRVVWQGLAATIPADYLVRRDGQLGVFVAEGDTARFVPIPDAQEGRPAIAALPGETRLITEGRQRLQDGMSIRLIARGDEAR